MPCTTVTLSACVRKEQLGAAIGLFYTGGFISIAISIAVTGFILSHGSAAYLQNHLSHLSSPVAGSLLATLQTVASGVRPLNAVAGFFIDTHLIVALQHLAYAAFMHAFSVAMIGCLVFSVLAFILTFFIVDSVSLTLKG